MNHLIKFKPRTLLLFFSTIISVSFSSQTSYSAAKKSAQPAAIAASEDRSSLPEVPPASFEGYTLSGSIPGLSFGWSIVGGRDVSGDGKADLVVSANYQSTCDPVCGQAFIYVYDAWTGKLHQTLSYEKALDSLGHALALGDINNDGVDDIIAGAPFASNWAGMAVVYSGSTFQELFVFEGEAADLFGWSVASGDVNQDGHDDIIIGAISTNQPFSVNPNGRVYVYSGADGSLLHLLNGEAEGDAMGSAVAVADFNADGFSDIVAGSMGKDTPGAFNVGSVSIFSGQDGSLVRQFDGTAAFDLFGSPLTTVADLSGDGVADLIISALGAVHASGSLGSVFVLASSDGAVLHRFDAGEGNLSFGYSLAAVADADGDAIADIYVGDPCFMVPGSFDCKGQTKLFSGASGAKIEVQTGLGDDRLGVSVASLGDLDGNNLSEIVSGACSAFGVGTVTVTPSSGGRVKSR